MKLEIDGRAVARFNEIGEQILGSLSRQPRQPVPQSHFKPDVHITASLTEKDIIGPVRVAQEIIDGTGARVGRVFEYDSHRVELVGEAFQRFIQLLDRISESGLKQTVSMKTLEETAVDWLQRRYGEVGDEQLLSYLLQEIEQTVKEQELWIPLHQVHLERPVVIGSVRFETISKAMLDEREAQLRERVSPVNWPRAAQRMERDRKRLQGMAAAVVVVTAEPTMADEVAREKSEQAVALLRFFSPTNRRPEMRSYCTLLGDEDLRTETVLRFHDGKLLMSQRVHDQRNRPEWFATPDIERYSDLLPVISQLASDADRTDFQKKLFDAMLLYSRNSVVREPVDKLVYIFAALESILLRNASEPIQDNIGLRVAFLVGHDLAARSEIAANLKEVYAQRSSFVHHGVSLRSAGAVAQFMGNAWACFYRLLELSPTVPSKAALLDELEARKYQ